MGEIARCPCCLGRKKLIGFGFMEETCANCKGVGSIETKDDVVTVAAAVAAEVKPTEVVPTQIDPVIVDNEVKLVEVVEEPVIAKKRPGRAIGSAWKKVKE